MILGWIHRTDLLSNNLVSGYLKIMEEGEIFRESKQRLGRTVDCFRLLVSSFFPMPAQFDATCEQMARQVAVAVEPVMQCEAISQYARSDIASNFGVWHDHRRE